MGWGLWEQRSTCSESPCPCRSRDFYHTCYCLSGLSIAQHFGSGAMLHDVVLGMPENALVRRDRVPRMGAYREGRAAALVLQNWLCCLDRLVSWQSPPSLGLQHSRDDVTVEEMHWRQTEGFRRGSNL